MKKQELVNILNSEEFGSEAWNEASDELHDIRVKEIESNKIENWSCDSDGEWWS